MSRIIQIGDTLYLAGMRWVSYTDKPDKADMISDAERYNANWYALRTGTALQCGFCDDLAPKIPKKLESLAARLAEAKIQPWLGVFEISAEDNLYWYIAVRDQHSILPGGDVIGSKEEIAEAQSVHQSYADWKYVEGDIELLQSLLQNQSATPTWVKSIKVSTSDNRTRWIAGGLTVSLLAALVGGYFWYDAFTQQENARLINQKREALKQQNRTAQEDELNLALKPLLTLPFPSDFLAACRNVLYASRLSDRGWIMERFLCSPETATIHRKRGNGASVGRLPDGAVLQDDGEALTQSTQAKPILPRKTLPSLIAFNEASLALRDWAQRANLSLTLTPPIGFMPKSADLSATTASLPGVSALLGTDKKSEALLPYVQSTFAVVLKFPPFDLQFAVPGLFITSLKTTADGYVLEGTLYGTR